MHFYLLRALFVFSLGYISIATVFAQHPKEQKVGVLLPLSGSLAEMGTSFRRGVELWQADHPGSQVSFIFEDHKYDGKAVVTGLHSLRGNTGVEMAIVWGNAPAGAAAPVAEQQKIPTLVISNNPDARGRSFVVSLGPPIDLVVDKIVEQFNAAGVRQPGAVTIDMGNAVDVIESVGRKYSGGSFTKIVSNEEVDFKPVINQLKSRGVDGIVLFLVPQQALTFLKQAKQMQYSPSIVGGDVFAVDSFQRSAAQLTTKVSFVYGSVVPEFIERLAAAPAGASYFFEAATGYSVAGMSAGLVEFWRMRGKGDDPFYGIASAKPMNLPIPRIEYKDDESFGRHFELGISAYPLILAGQDRTSEVK